MRLWLERSDKTMDFRKTIFKKYHYFGIIQWFFFPQRIRQNQLGWKRLMDTRLFSWCEWPMLFSAFFLYQNCRGLQYTLHLLSKARLSYVCVIHNNSCLKVKALPKSLSFTTHAIGELFCCCGGFFCFSF